ncbi:hypothetical protein K456DRAFT_733923 [Colletotrichum gloeosporioides 23]|nr:hypothetical protein K456DRAFT_733923 [Colletotrichum gloeosporioides 23]
MLRKPASGWATGQQSTGSASLRVSELQSRIGQRPRWLAPAEFPCWVIHVSAVAWISGSPTLGEASPTMTASYIRHESRQPGHARPAVTPLNDTLLLQGGLAHSTSAQTWDMAREEVFYPRPRGSAHAGISEYSAKVQQFRDPSANGWDHDPSNIRSEGSPTKLLHWVFAGRGQKCRPLNLDVHMLVPMKTDDWTVPRGTAGSIQVGFPSQQNCQKREIPSGDAIPSALPDLGFRRDDTSIDYIAYTRPNTPGSSITARSTSATSPTINSSADQSCLISQQIEPIVRLAR